MQAEKVPHRWLQFVALAIVSVFILGFVFSPLGAWTGSVLGAWFIGTQKARRGFILLAGISCILNLFWFWRAFRLGGMESTAWAVLAVVLGVLPFLFYRLVTQRRPGFLATLSLPLWGVALAAGEQRLLPARLGNWYSLAHTQAGILPLSRLAAILGAGAVLFLIYWFAAAIVWMWNLEFQTRKIAAGASIFGAVCVLAVGFGFFAPLTASLPPHVHAGLVWACCVGALSLSAWSFLRPSLRRQAWADKTETISLLRSPYSGNALSLASENGQEALVSTSEERFPIRHGIPVFLEREKLTGPNRKYNRLYETMGGLYDDFQKLEAALHGNLPYEDFSIHHRFLEIAPGNLVLETSVGTGLNFKYLPRGVKLFGLDLAAEMLANCQVNLRRWELDADLFLGNAEALPFADNSFDVVFHVGGINFFSDRAKAIREMIRVAKPGTRILIADETEEYVKSAYERIPITRGYFKNRQEAVTAPIDLVPPDMQEVHLESLLEGKFYALTFRKPAAGLPHVASAA